MCTRSLELERASDEYYLVHELTCVYARVRVRVHACLGGYARPHALARTQTYTRTHSRTQERKHPRTHTQTYKHAHAHAFPNTRRRIRVFAKTNTRIRIQIHGTRHAMLSCRLQPPRWPVATTPSLPPMPDDLMDGNSLAHSLDTRTHARLTHARARAYTHLSSPTR